MDLIFLVSSIGFFFYSIMLQLGEIRQKMPFQKKRFFIILVLISLGFMTLIISKEPLLFIFHLIVILFFLTGGLLEFLQIMEKKIFFDFGQKVIFLTSTLVLILLFAFPIIDFMIWFLLLLLLLPFIVKLCQYLFHFPQELYADFQIQKIQKERKKKKEVKIICIYHQDVSPINLTKVGFLKKKEIFIGKSQNLHEYYKLLKKSPNTKKSILIVQSYFPTVDIKNVLYSLRPNVIIEITQKNRPYIKKLRGTRKIIHIRDVLAKKNLPKVLKNFAK